MTHFESLEEYSILQMLGYINLKPAMDIVGVH